MEANLICISEPNSGSQQTYTAIGADRAAPGTINVTNVGIVISTMNIG